MVQHERWITRGVLMLVLLYEIVFREFQAWCSLPSYRAGQTNTTTTTTSSSSSLVPTASTQEEAASSFLKNVSRMAAMETSHGHANLTTVTTATPSFHQLPPLPPRAHNEWCPFAECTVTPGICHPCRRRYLILICSGRSGSTTLQNLLNALPGFRIGGENQGMLTHLQHALDHTRRTTIWFYQDRHDKRPGNPWFHYPVTNSSFACVTQQMTETINPPPPDRDHNDDETIVGFKTIRFPMDLSPKALSLQQPNDDDEEDYTSDDFLQRAADFLIESFPCSRILVNLRSELPAQAHSILHGHGSGHKQRHKKREAQRSKGVAVPPLATPVEIEGTLQRTNAALQTLARKLGPHRARLLDATEWTQTLDVFNQQVLPWLGFDKQCRFVKLPAYNTGEKAQLEQQDGILSKQCTRLPYQ